MIAAIVTIVIVVILIGLIIGLYNNLISLRNRVDNAWAQVEAQMQRRLDLIPNLVETVKGYATHEKTTFENVTKARSAVMDAKTPAEEAQADNFLTDTLKSLFAVSEAYPDLKANQNFLDLQAQLRDTEDKISYMRQSYNDTVLRYNNAIQTFPGNIFASMFHFEKRENFEAAPAAAAAPRVDFGSNTGGNTTEQN